jgi:ribosomal-protein-alanine N-acetyltransferase
MPKPEPDIGYSQSSGSNSSRVPPTGSRAISPPQLQPPYHSTDGLPYVVEPMRLSDLDEVMEIEKVAFPAPWSARSYRYEITQNEHGTLIVVRPAPRLRQHLPKWLSWLSRAGRGPVLGYAGLWLLVDEAHIATIAVHPDWRGRGLGELLLLAIMEKGAEQGARQATLEVRVHNQIAQGLYRKVGFETAGIRKGYYIDIKEDALIMTTPSFDTPEFQWNLDRCRTQLYTRLRQQGSLDHALDIVRRTS